MPTPATTPSTPTYFQQSLPAMSPAIAPPTPSTPEQQATTTTTAPIVRKHKFPTPLLRLQLHDLAHEGASIFLSNIHGNEDLSLQVQNVLNLLYSNADPKDLKARPPTRSVTFIIRAFEGVAYTTGIDLDDDHKEINISADYIVKCARGPGGNKRHELLGVICHELVHCFQWNAQGTCPGGLIEGIADWVRLRAGLGASHWRQEAGGQWDGGYQKTGYFLDWLEVKFGHGTVAALNACMREEKYDGEKLFGECCQGAKVEELWKAYREELHGKEKKVEGGGDDDDGPANPVPTHPAKGT